MKKVEIRINNYILTKIGEVYVENDAKDSDIDAHIRWWLDNNIEWDYE